MAEQLVEVPRAVVVFIYLEEEEVEKRRALCSEPSPGRF